MEQGPGPCCKMMGPNEAGCIAQMGPRTVASSLVSRSSLSANNLKGGLQNGTCHPCSKTGLQKWLPPSSPSPKGMPVASCLSKNLSKMNKLVWCFFHLTASAVGLRTYICMCLFRAKSLFPKKNNAVCWHSFNGLFTSGKEGLWVLYCQRLY